MLLMPKDKKRVASIIVAGLQPSFVGKDKGGNDKEFDLDELKEESCDVDDGLVACAEALITSMKKGNAEELASILKDFVEMAQGAAEIY